MDCTGNFPIRSLNGMVTIFILYDWSSNAILAEPIPDTKDATIIRVFKEGFQPRWGAAGELHAHSKYCDSLDSLIGQEYQTRNLEIRVRISVQTFSQSWSHMRRGGTFEAGLARH